MNSCLPEIKEEAVMLPFVHEIIDLLGFETLFVS